jgi:hypothetical protein
MFRAIPYASRVMGKRGVPGRSPALGFGVVDSERLLRDPRYLRGGKGRGRDDSDSSGRRLSGPEGGRDSGLAGPGKDT